jgi:hypothetical protein
MQGRFVGGKVEKRSTWGNTKTFRLQNSEVISKYKVIVNKIYVNRHSTLVSLRKVSRLPFWYTEQKIWMSKYPTSVGTSGVRTVLSMLQSRIKVLGMYTNFGRKRLPTHRILYGFPTMVIFAKEHNLKSGSLLNINYGISSNSGSFSQHSVASVLNASTITVDTIYPRYSPLKHKHDVKEIENMFVATINLLKIRKCVSSEDQKGSEYN